MDQFGKNSIVLNTFPTDVNEVTGKSFIEDCLENIKNSNDELEHPYYKLAWNISTNYAHSRLRNMERKEMAFLTDCLFSCNNSITNIKGLPIVKEITQEEINKKFN